MKKYTIEKIQVIFSAFIKTALTFFSCFIYLFFKNSFTTNILTIKHFSLKSKLALTFIIYNLTLNIALAQTYPVQINTQLVPPYSGYLPDYADPNAQNLKVFLQFNDFTVPQYNLRLKFEIKGDGFSLATKAQYNPPPISLQPGQPVLLSGADLAPYLNSNNLDFIGFNKNQYEQRMALPEGYYSICITAYDYYSGTPIQVSNEACGQGWFTLSNPPLLNLPLCNAVVNPLQPQNLFFNWTPINLGSPNSAFSTSYLFELWEMRPDSTVNPNQLVQNTQPVYSTTTSINSLNYGITETPLNLYYKYAWRVKAIDGSGKDWFINNGYSQVCTFYYGSIGNTLGNAVNLNLEAQALDYVNGIATWTLQSFYNSYQLDVREVNTQDWISYTTTINTKELNNLQPNKTYECRVKGFGNDINGNYSNIVSFTTPNPPSINLQAEALDYTTGRAFWLLQNSYNNYQIEVRKKNTANWFPYTTSGNSQVIENLESNKTYECRVKGYGTNFTSDHSNIAEFTTPAPPSYNCNQAAPVYSNNTTPLPYNKAITGMTVKSGQFDVKIKLISPGTMGAGYYTGNGYAMMFGVLPIPVTFTNVFIDANQRQQQGIIHAVTKGMKKWMQQFDIEDAEEIATYVDGTLDSVYISNGQYCYITKQNPTPVCAPIDTTKLPLVIRDGDGNQYVINEGPPPSVTGPTSYLNLSNDNLAATDNLKVQFVKATNQNFGFDNKEYPAFTEEYECIKLSNGKNYFVANKSIGNGINQNDKVIATYTIQNFNAAQLVFKTKGGATLTKTGINNNSSFEITNIPPNADCIYAWYNGQKIGKLNIISLNKISKKVVLVPVNGASTAGITQQGLNDIYKQANASFTLTTAPNFTFNLGNDGLQEADATLLKKYSTEMRALRDAYKAANSNYDKNAYYIFVVPNFSNAQLEGYMVRGKAVGFIKANGPAKTLAHELAHGAFGLEHTFPAIQKNGSNNLLDDSNGMHLVKTQWEQIQNPGVIISWLDDEEDGSLNNTCHRGLTPEGKMFDECFDQDGKKINPVFRITQGTGWITSLFYNQELYNWSNTQSKYVNSNAQKLITVSVKQKPQNNKVNIYRINAPGCSYQSTSIIWTSQDENTGGDLQARIENKLNDSTLWDTDLFFDVKNNTCGTGSGLEISGCPSFPQNMSSVDLNYLKNNFFAFRSTSCLSTLIFSKRMQLIREILNNWVVTECLQNINPNIPTIGNCYEPLVYKLILSTPNPDAKQVLDSLIAQNLLYPLLDKTQLTTFDEIAKKLALWQITYYPLSGTNAILGKINNTTKALEFLENKVDGYIGTNGITLTREAYGFCKECTPVVANTQIVPAMSYVLVNFKDKVDVFNAGTKARMPAIFALYLFNKDRRELIQTSGKLLFDIGMLAIGIGEVQAAFNAYKVGKTAYQTYLGIKALTDVGMALGDMVVNTALADSWKDTPAGIARLERWNNITMYWAMGSISASALDGVIGKYCNNINNTNIIKSEKDFDDLADKLEGVVNGAGNLAEDITNFYSIDRALQSKNLVEEFNLTQFASAAAKDEVVAIHRYTVNNFELTVSAYGGNYTAVQQSWMNLIKSGMVKLSSGNTFVGKVYRGSNLSPSNLQPFLDAWASTAKTIKIPPIQSTSKLESVANHFINKFKAPGKSEVMFEIQSKTGVYIDDISDYGKKLGPKRHPSDPIQEEVLLFDNKDFQITNLQTITKSDGTIRYIIEMIEL